MIVPDASRKLGHGFALITSGWIFSSEKRLKTVELAVAHKLSRPSYWEAAGLIPCERKVSFSKCLYKISHLSTTLYFFAFFLKSPLSHATCVTQPERTLQIVKVLI